MANKKKKVSTKQTKKAHKQKARASKIAKQKANNSSSISFQYIEEQCDEIIDFIEEGELKSAKNKLKKINSKKVAHPFISFTNGLFSLKTVGEEEALKHFKKATLLDPLYIEAHYNVAACYKELLQIGKMLSSFLKVVEIGEETDDLVIRAQGLLNSFQETLDEDEALSISDYIRGEELFAQALYLLEQEEPENALELFNENLKISPNHTQTHGNIGICYVKLGNKEKALESFEKALNIDPTYQLALLNKEIILQNGIEESQSQKLGSVNYFQDYGITGRSYIEDVKNDSVKLL